VTLRSALPADAERVGEIFLAARQTAMPWLARPHTDDETRGWICRVLVPGGHVTVAERAGEVVGFAEVEGGWLHHLYVAPPAQGAGVGSRLLTHTQALEPRGFQLWVFQRNTRALSFYARYGCLEVQRTDGADNEEREPDVLLRWAPAGSGAV